MKRTSWVVTFNYRCLVRPCQTFRRPSPRTVKDSCLAIISADVFDLGGSCFRSYEGEGLGWNTDVEPRLSLSVLSPVRLPPWRFMTMTEEKSERQSEDTDF